MYKRVFIPREELYQKVWAQPVSTVAAEIGISGVVLGKACRRAGIPLPGRGYWAALQSGRKIRVPSLPTLAPGQPGVVQIRVRESRPAPYVDVAAPAHHPITVPTKLVRPHRLVAELKAAAVDADEDKGVLVLNYKKVLRVRTSSTHLRRALILMNTLIKHFEALGLSVRIGSAYTETELVLREGAVRFRLDERTKRTEPSPARSGRTKRSRIESEYSPWQPRYTMVSTGEFTLSFGQYQLSGCRCLWKDKPGQLLESQLHQIVGAVPSWEAALKAQRQERERWQLLAREAEEQQIAAARAAEILRLQRVRLVNQLTAWERAERLRRFAEALKRSELQTPEFKSWISWVIDQTEKLDPLCHDLHALSNFQVRLEPQFTRHWHLNEPTENWWDTSATTSDSEDDP